MRGLGLVCCCAIVFGCDSKSSSSGPLHIKQLIVAGQTGGGFCKPIKLQVRIGTVADADVEVLGVKGKTNNVGSWLAVVDAWRVRKAGNTIKVSVTKSGKTATKVLAFTPAAANFVDDGKLVTNKNSPPVIRFTSCGVKQVTTDHGRVDGLNPGGFGVIVDVASVFADDKPRADYELFAMSGRRKLVVEARNQRGDKAVRTIDLAADGDLRDQLRRRLGQVGSRPLAFAAAYKGAAPHPVVSVDSKGSFARYPGLRGRRLRDVQLIDVADVTWKKGRRCGPYQAYPGQPRRYTRMLRYHAVHSLYEAKTGNKIASKRFVAKPARCPRSVRVYGSRSGSGHNSPIQYGQPPHADIAAWLGGFTAKPL